MSDMVSTDAAVSGGKLYRAIWRWHFYAGLYVVPFLLMLSITGLIILWVTAISPEFGDRLSVAKTGEPMRITAQANAALKAYPEGKIGQYIAPLGPENPVLFRVDRDGGARMLALDPYTGTILQDTAKDGTWNEFATNIHGKLLWGGNGGPGDTLIEIAASLGVLLVVTGLYLWWPRGSNTLGKALVPQFSAKGRLFWKSLHSSLGAWISIILLFFFLSGLAWAQVWGNNMVQAWSTFPAEKWDAVPLSDKSHASMNSGSVKEVPWTLEQTLMPASGSTAGVTGLPEGIPVNLDSIVALGRAIGFDARFQVAVPGDDTGVWTLSRDSMSYDSSNPFGDRTVHVDQYTGKILAEAAYKDYPVLGKAMAVGIALHEGQTGLWNIIANLLFCLSVITICISGIVMWWKRRPAGTFGAPLYARETKIPLGILGLGLIIALSFPLGGAAIAVFAVIDFLLPKSWKQAGSAA